MTTTSYHRAPGDLSNSIDKQETISSGMLVCTIRLLLAVILSSWVANTSLLSAAGMMPPADLMDMQMHS